MKKIIVKSFGIILSIIFVAFCLNINYSAVTQMPNDLSITLEDLNDMNSQNVFGNFISANVEDNIFSVGGNQKRCTYLQLKLFGFIPIRKVETTIYKEEQIYLGGIPLGFAINSNGLIVVGEKNENGKRNPFKSGDVIIKIDESIIDEPQDVANVLANITTDNPITITILRDGEEKYIVVVPKIDEVSGERKLGLWVRDDAQGIGTLTFVTKDGKFGALGHAICDYETGVEIPVKDGGIYLCNLIGINKAQKGKAGELRCLFSLAKSPYGEVNLNSKSGVFGVTNQKEKLIDKNMSAQIGSRMIVKLGKAKIVSSVSGIREEYDIEIIKAKYQPTQSDKSFVLRVIDKRLISLTGGIVQGMSGSPIMQNGKLIGAVTHVFLNDATKGYGIYVDWMMQEIK